MNVQNPNVRISDVSIIVRLSTSISWNVQISDVLASLDHFIYIFFLNLKWSSLVEPKDLLNRMNQTELTITEQNFVQFVKPNVPFSDVHCI